MDDIIEFILELILEGMLELSSNKKVPKWIRYPLSFILILLVSIIIIGLIVLAMYTSKENILISIIFIVSSIALLLGVIKKIKTTCTEKKDINKEEITNNKKEV